MDENYITRYNINKLIEARYYGDFVLLYDKDTNTLSILETHVGQNIEICHLQCIREVHFIDNINLQTISDKICLKYPDKWAGIDGLDIDKYQYAIALFIDNFHQVILHIEIDTSMHYYDEYDHISTINIYLGRCVLMLDDISEDLIDHNISELLFEMADFQNNKVEECKYKYGLWDTKTNAFTYANDGKIPVFESVDTANDFIIRSSKVSSIVDNLVSIPINVDCPYNCLPEDLYDADKHYFNMNKALIPCTSLYDISESLNKLKSLNDLIIKVYHYHILITTSNNALNEDKVNNMYIRAKEIKTVIIPSVFNINTDKINTENYKNIYIEKADSLNVYFVKNSKVVLEFVYINKDLGIKSNEYIVIDNVFSFQNKW